MPLFTFYVESKREYTLNFSALRQIKFNDLEIILPSSLLNLHNLILEKVVSLIKIQIFIW